MMSNQYSQGDIILIPYPYTDLSGIKKRPVVIVSRQTDHHQNHIVAKITSVIRNDSFSYPLTNSCVESPLPKESEVRVHEIFTVNESIIIKKLSKIKNDNLIDLTSLIVKNLSVE